MATIKKASFGTLYKGYIARLKALGCVFCPECYAYVTPEHAAHYAQSGHADAALVATLAASLRKAA